MRFPARRAAQIPSLTRSHIPAGIPSAQIDAAVSASLDALGSLYELDLRRLQALKPDLILTQRLCDVCAVSFDRVEDAVSKLPWGPQVLNLEPHSLVDVLGTIHTVGGALGRGEAAQKVVASLRARIEAVRERSAGATRRPRVLALSGWTRPSALVTGYPSGRNRRRALRSGQPSSAVHAIGMEPCGGVRARGDRAGVLRFHA